VAVICRCFPVCVLVTVTMLGQAARPSWRYGRLDLTSLLVCLLAFLMLAFPVSPI
jgi:hypothetical protein